MYEQIIDRFFTYRNCSVEMAYFTGEDYLRREDKLFSE